MVSKLIYLIIAITALIVTYYYYFKKGNKKWPWVIISILCGGVWLYLKGAFKVPDVNDYACNVYSYYKGTKMNKELVVNKIDLLHMMAQVLILKRYGEDKLDPVYFNDEKTNTYNEINKGDTLVKNKNSDSLFIIKNNMTVFITRLNCGCDTTQYKKEHGQSIEERKQRKD